MFSFSLINQHILSLMIWIPILSGGLLLLANKSTHLNIVRGIAIAVATLLCVLSIPLALHFHVYAQHLQFVEIHAWIPLIHAQYALGIDGISLLFILLTTYATLIVIIAACSNITEKVAQYMAIFLISEGLTIGVFSASDALLFYTFWEAAIIPMTIGIGVWGGVNRARAAIKFFLFTFLGSIFLLLAILYLAGRNGNFDIAQFLNLHLTPTEQWFIFIAFWLGFAVKIPMWPVHTWLPDAHTEAPAGGSIILAALMLKMGAYGFVRFTLPMLPYIHDTLDWTLIALSLIAIVYVGIIAISQTDVKRLIAYSSISHMGLVTLGLFIIFELLKLPHGQANAAFAIEGSIFQMIAHAFSSGGMFLAIGYIGRRMGTYDYRQFGGLAFKMPILAVFFMLFCLANIGLPGTSGFVGEFMILLATFKVSIWLTIIAGLTLILAPAYTLYMYKNVFFGKITNHKINDIQDLTRNETFVLILLAVPVILFGVYPEPILHLAQSTSSHVIYAILN